MLNPTIDELLEIAKNRYILSIAVSKRARQIVEGSPANIDLEECLSNSDAGTGPMSTAIHEIYFDKIQILK